MNNLLKELCILCIRKHGLTKLPTDRGDGVRYKAGDVSFYKPPMSVEWFAIVTGAAEQFAVCDEVYSYIQHYMPMASGACMNDYETLFSALIAKNK